jgi:hypothetical protein
MRNSNEIGDLHISNHQALMPSDVLTLHNFKTSS